MTGRLTGRTAIVTGGAMGLGNAFARRLAEDGANVVIADLKDAAPAAAQLAASGAHSIGITTDICDEASVSAMAEAALQAFGRIDILVNNAAYFATSKSSGFENVALAEWRRMLDTNVIGTFLCCRAVAPAMKKQHSGRMVILSSGTAIKGAAGHLHYVASKGALIAMTRSLARELGRHGITVNAVAPGLTLSQGVVERGLTTDEQLESQRRSRAIPRDQQPADLVGAVSFLASDDAAFITGQTLVVDGGSAMV
jgi:NAD(P)-dependent dehydrogenase (short-subunit alcohol dehydrogenase family)